MKKQYFQTKYKLISFVINSSLAYFKSMESSAWYKYTTNVKMIKSINDNQYNVPYVLIYKQKPPKQYNFYK